MDSRNHLKPYIKPNITVVALAAAPLMGVVSEPVGDYDKDDVTY